MSVDANSRISEIPIELLEKILGSLHDDPAALRSASLVCRDWLPAQRYHMFHQTVIKEFSLILGTRPLPLVHANIREFLSLVQSEHCTILPAIRCAIICANSPTVLIEVFKVLAGAKALSQMVFFQNGSAFDSKLAEQPGVAHMLPNIQDLTFNAWGTLDDNSWRFIASFTHLRALAIHVEHDTPMTFPRDISGTSFSNIVNFQLRTLKSEELFEWMNSLEGFALARVEMLDLRILRSAHKSWGPISALNAFLKRNSETLTSVSVAVDYLCSATDFSEEHIDLSPLINLRSLFLQTHDVDAVCHSIASLNSRFVECLTVRTHMWETDKDGFFRECHCDLYELYIKLASIMEKKDLYTETTMRHIEVPKQRQVIEDPNSYAFGNLSVRWTKRGDLIPLSEHDYDKQCNTVTSLSSLIWKEYKLDEIRRYTY